jgi:subtilase family serine protease
VNGTIKLVAPLVAALAMAACSGGTSNMPGTTGMTGSGQSVVSHSHPMPQWKAQGLAHAACPQVVGVPTCLALISDRVSPACTGSSCGWAPKDFQTRYNLPITKGSGNIVAIVDAGDNPDTATDIAEYRTEFGLGTADFHKYNQEGEQSNYPSYTGWSVEIDLDIEMVSASCPLCTIYLVEANSANSSDLDTAETEAVTLGAHIVSNSWICYGSNNCVTASDYDHSGVTYLASSGDAGYNENGNPESLASVVSVGGTQLMKSGSTYSETVWDDAGGGCSSNGGSSGVTKPSWQKDPSCTWRTDADVSAESGCSPPVAEYDSYDGGWFGVCGTSVASPLTGGIYGLAGNASSRQSGKDFWTLKGKKRKKDLHDITSGNDGSCGGSYLCTAGTGQFKTYAGPTGWGTPNGIKAY